MAYLRDCLWPVLWLVYGAVLGTALELSKGLFGIIFVAFFMDCLLPIL